MSHASPFLTNWTAIQTNPANKIATFRISRTTAIRDGGRGNTGHDSLSSFVCNETWDEPLHGNY